MNQGGGGPFQVPGWIAPLVGTPPPGAPYAVRNYQGAATPVMGWPGGGLVYPQLDARVLHGQGRGWPLQQSGSGRIAQGGAWSEMHQPENMATSSNSLVGAGPGGNSLGLPSSPATPSSSGVFQSPSPLFSPKVSTVGHRTGAFVQGASRGTFASPIEPGFVFGRGGDRSEGHALGPTSEYNGKLKVADNAAVRVYNEALAEGKNITVSKICQATMSVLGVSSFESLGFRMQDVPCLRKLALAEGKVNAFIHSHVAGKRITTAYDLCRDLTCDEGVAEFDDLGLGPLNRHPLVIHYFSPPAEGDVLKITAAEVIQHLSDFIGDPGPSANVELEKFMVFLQKERKTPTRQHLCVRVQSLGLHIGAVLRAKRAEVQSVRNWEALARTQFELKSKSSVISRVTAFLSSENPAAKVEAKKLKRKRWTVIDLSDDETSRPEKKSQGDTDASKKKAVMREIIDKLPGARNSLGPSNCPYPSAAEENARAKRQKNLQAELEREWWEGGQLSWTAVADFLIILKDACRGRTVSQVLEYLLDTRTSNMYWKAAVKKTKVVAVFKEYPAIGLLYAAVMSVKVGHWDSLYDAFQEESVQQDQKMTSQTVAITGPIDVGCAPVAHFHSPTTEPGVAAPKSTVESVVERKPCTNAQVPLHRVLAFISQAVFACENGGVTSHRRLSSLVCRQFNILNIEDLGAGSLDFLVKQSKEMQLATPSNASVFFMGALVPGMGQSEAVEESQEPVIHVETLSKVGVLGSMMNTDALNCLKGAPMLVDLTLWSQWNAVFAPTQGPLLDWLEREGPTSGIHSLMTDAGLILRIDGTATVDQFLMATVKGHGEQVAAQLVSLVAMYGGVAHAPLALLKTHATKAIGVLLDPFTSNPLDYVSENTFSSLSERNFAHSKNMAVNWADMHQPLKKACFSPSTNSGNMMRNSLRYGNTREKETRATTVAMFLVKVMYTMPRELRVFAAEIFLSAFSSAIPGAHSIIMDSCQILEHSLMLHEVGLQMGIPEWIDDFSSFVLATTSSEDPGQLCRDQLTEPNIKEACSFTVAATSIGSLENSSVCASGHREQAGLKLEVESIGNAGYISCIQTGNDETVNIKGSTELAPTDLLPEAGMDSEWEPYERLKNTEEVAAQTFKQKLEEGASGVEEELLAGKCQVADGNRVRDNGKEVVEAIRRDEFGVGQDLESREHDLLARQHARMGRALHRLSRDLYSQDSHFVLELVQNADDNTYEVGVKAALVFVVRHGHVVVLNNEKGFTPANLRALCDVGNSTKAGTNTGYIGHKGIGFKSVFRVTDSPEIHSNGFHVKFDITESDLGFILPTIVPPCTDSFEEVLHLVEQKRGTSENNQASWNTRIDLPIKASLRDGQAMDSLAAKFDDIHPSLLLFLHRLHCIAVQSEVVDSTQVMYREDVGNGLVRVVHNGGSAMWLVVKHQLTAAVPRAGRTLTELALAFTLRELSGGQYEASPEQQQVFAFLPLRAYGLRFIVQGDFILPSSREDVDRDSAWNQWLRSEIPEAFIKAADFFKSLPSLESAGRAMTNYLRFVPLEGEVVGFFSPLPRMILGRLRTTPCLPIEGAEKGWALPCMLLRGWNDTVRKLLPDPFLKEHLGLQYLDGEVELSNSLASSLGVQMYGVRTLVAIMKSLCLKKGGLEGMGPEWVRDWLIALHDCLLAEQHRTQFLPQQETDGLFPGDLQTLQFIPLSNGTFTALVDGPVWFSGQSVEHSSVINNPLSFFPLLLSELRTVHPLLMKNTIDCDAGLMNHLKVNSLKGSNAENTGKVTSILQKLGVNPISAHEVMKSHVLSAMAEESCLIRETPLVVQFLGYIKCHLESGCTQCTLDRADILVQLQKSAIILTSNGLRRASREQIHFGATMGNPFDVRSILEGTPVNWNEVDATYLQLQSPEDQGSSPESWRKFLQGLGVTDFVQMVSLERHIQDKAATLWRRAEWEGDGRAGGGWVVQDSESPELLEILNAVCGLEEEAGRKGKKAYRKAIFNCTSLLSALDKLWDEEFSSFSKGTYRLAGQHSDTIRRETEASWVLQMREFKWVLSSLDGQLHLPTTLFQRCEAVSRILGSHAPYALPQMQSTGLMTALGLRTEVRVDDALVLLRHWGESNGKIEASVAQMAQFYLFLSEKMPTHKEEVLAVIRSTPSIFVPWKGGSARERILEGNLYLVESVCWSDPTGALQSLISMKGTACERGSEPSSSADQGALAVKPLSGFYPELQDFFVRECLVQETPSFDGYLSILQSLAALCPPSKVLDQVLEVFAAWSWEIECGKVTEAELLRWKAQLQDVGCMVLPTVQNNWVSLSDQAGFICVCDDLKLGMEFRDAQDGLHFLQITCTQFPENAVKHKRDVPIRRTMQPLLSALGIPLLSQVVEREVITHGSHDGSQLEALIMWALPYAQRYVRHHHFEHYKSLQSMGIVERLKKLKCLVVDQLYFRYSLQNGRHRSLHRIECGCVLQGSFLHTAVSQAKDHCMVYAELSRFFFSNQPNLQLANFLHLITLMASLRSPERDVESFTINGQGIQQLPDGDVPWTVDLTTREEPPANLTSLTERIPTPGEMYLQRQVDLEESRLQRAKNSRVYSGWPPRTWVPVPRVKAMATFSFKEDQQTGTSLAGVRRTGTVPKATSRDLHMEMSHGDRVDRRPPTEETTISSREMVPEHSTDEDNSHGASRLFTTSEGPPQTETPLPVQPVPNIGVSRIRPVQEVVLHNGGWNSGTDRETSGAWARDQLVLDGPTEEQRELTGRSGEALVFQYLSGKHGPTHVKWVNQDGETGAAFDMIVTMETGQQEFVEVKTTRSQDKDWFEISPREWDFAQIHGDLYTIIRVFLTGPGQPMRILRIPNPVRLCQERVLQLALLLPSNNSVGNDSAKDMQLTSFSVNLQGAV